MDNGLLFYKMLSEQVTSSTSFSPTGQVQKPTLTPEQESEMTTKYINNDLKKLSVLTQADSYAFELINNKATIRQDWKQNNLVIKSIGFSFILVGSNKTTYTGAPNASLQPKLGHSKEIVKTFITTYKQLQSPNLYNIIKKLTLKSDNPADIILSYGQDNIMYGVIYTNEYNTDHKYVFKIYKDTNQKFNLFIQKLISNGNILSILNPQ